MGSSIFLSYASEQSEVAAQIELSLKGDRHSVFRDRTSLPPGDYLALFRWLFPEDDLKQGSGAPSLFEFLFVLAQLQEQASDQAGALSSYRRLLSEFKKENYDSSRATKIAKAANAAIERLSSWCKSNSLVWSMRRSRENVTPAVHPRRARCESDRGAPLEFN